LGDKLGVCLRTGLYTSGQIVSMTLFVPLPEGDGMSFEKVTSIEGFQANGQMFKRIVRSVRKELITLPH
jgi:hypothetical protein